MIPKLLGAAAVLVELTALGDAATAEPPRDEALLFVPVASPDFPPTPAPPEKEVCPDPATVLDAFPEG